MKKQGVTNAIRGSEQFTITEKDDNGGRTSSLFISNMQSEYDQAYFVCEIKIVELGFNKQVSFSVRLLLLEKV